MVHMTIGHNAGKCHPRRRQKKSQHRCPAIGVAYRESGEGFVSWDATDSTRTLHTEEIVQAYWGMARITSAVPHRFSHRGRAGSMSTSSANPLMVKIDISRGDEIDAVGAGEQHIDGCTVQILHRAEVDGERFAAVAEFGGGAGEGLVEG